MGLAYRQAIASIICIGSFRNHTRYGLGAETLPLGASSVTVCDCLLVSDMVLPYLFIIHRKQGCTYCFDILQRPYASLGATLGVIGVNLPLQCF